MAKPALLDCLEFKDELRYLDRIDDAAFWPWDLEFWPQRSWGLLLAGYAVRSRLSRQPLRDFIAYRAVVRGAECVRL